MLLAPTSIAKESNVFLDHRNPQAALHIEPGIVRMFGSSDIACQGLISGWANPEEGHNWNDGFDAVLALSITKVTKPLIMEIEGQAYIPRKTKMVQDVTLYANGLRIGFWRLAEPNSAVLAAPIEVEHWLNREGKHYAKLVFHIPNSMRPSEVQDGQDDRMLGFVFRTLSLKYSKAL